MIAETPTTPVRSRRKNDRRYYTSFALLVVIALVIIWQAVTYRGVIAVLAEWQFDLLGRYHPILTYLLLVLLLGLPLYLIGFVQKPAARRRAALPLRATQRALRLARALFAAAVASAVAAIVAVALIWTLPPSDGVPVRVAVADAKAPPIGPATLEGKVIYDRITVLDERLWFFGRNIRFVPVIAPGGGGRGSTLRYFVALPKLDLEGRDATPREWEGTLRKGGLPGEIIRLYRYAGYRVEAPYYVLFTKADMLTWPNRMLALQFTIGGLIFLLGGLLQLAHARRMQRALEPAVAPPAETPLPDR